MKLRAAAASGAIEKETSNLWLGPWEVAAANKYHVASSVGSRNTLRGMAEKSRDSAELSAEALNYLANRGMSFFLRGFMTLNARGEALGQREAKQAAM